MKSFQGVSTNINSPIMGVITRRPSHNWFKRKKKINVFCVNGQFGKIAHANAYILAGESAHKYSLDAPFIQGFSQAELNDLNDGDIVLLTRDGKINVIYSIQSIHNAIFATNRCNLHCLMCPQPSNSDTEDILKNNLSLIRLMDPNRTEHLAITGGEPTLLGKGLLDLIQECKKYLPKTALVILTNGLKLAELDFVKKIAEVNHPNLVFAIPLYSDNDAIHDMIVGASGSFYKTIKGLHNLALFRYRVEIRTVIHALNNDRILQLSEFIYRNFPFTAHIALMALEMTGIAKVNAAKLWIDPYDYTDELEKTVQYLHRADMNVSIYNHQLCTLPSSLWYYSRKSISGWKNEFLEECACCVQKSNCGGFFETGRGYHSKHIHPFL
jgi:His-Xaa-Ser system radical SAM maturase HxsC